jgi:hypothetical protein
VLPEPLVPTMKIGRDSPGAGSGAISLLSRCGHADRYR